MEDHCLELNPGSFRSRSQKDRCPAASGRGDRKNAPRGPSRHKLSPRKNRTKEQGYKKNSEHATRRIRVPEVCSNNFSKQSTNNSVSASAWKGLRTDNRLGNPSLGKHLMALDGVEELRKTGNQLFCSIGDERTIPQKKKDHLVVLAR